MTGPAPGHDRREALGRLFEDALGRPLRELEQQMLDLVPAGTVTVADWSAAVQGGAETFDDIVSAAFTHAVERGRAEDGSQAEETEPDPTSVLTR